MAETNPSSPSPASSDFSTVARQLAALDAALVETVQGTRRRNSSLGTLSLILIVFLIGYLGYAHYRFGNEVTPDLVATNAQAQFEHFLPRAREQLETNLKANAPHFVASALDELGKVPNRFAEGLDKEASKRMDNAMPAVEESVYVALRVELNDARQSKVGSDEQRFQTMLDALGRIYGEQTLKFVDQIHRTYSTEAVDFVNYLDRLALNQNLDHRDQLHREMFRTMFTLVRQHDQQGATVFKTTLLEPAQ